MKENFMKQALIQAQKALKKGDVTVGAVVVREGKIIAKAYNKKERKQNAINHAEILAISKACKKLHSFRLDECDLYVTLEPCPMCCGAILGARVKNLFFGAYDKDYGCAGSHYNFPEDKNFNHHPNVEGGILEEECSKIVTDFFKELRKKKRKNKNS